MRTRAPRWVSVVMGVGTVLAGWWGWRLLRLRCSVGRYRDYWSVPRGQPGGLLYVALGDSTAQGIGASGPERGYVGITAARLRAATGRPVEVVNLSRTGARVRAVALEQLPRLNGLSPDLVTVGVGGNDVKRYAPTSFRADVDALIDGLPPGTVMADVPWFMHGGLGRDSKEAAAYVAIRAQALGLPVAHVHRATRARGWMAMVTDFAADWFHPNDRGHRVWADAFWDALGGAGFVVGS